MARRVKVRESRPGEYPFRVSNVEDALPRPLLDRRSELLSDVSDFYSDRRQFSPIDAFAVDVRRRVVSQPRASIRSTVRRRLRLDHWMQVLRLPDNVRVCIGRKVRREVLFARRKAGFSGSARGRYKRTYFSQFSC